MPQLGDYHLDHVWGTGAVCLHVAPAPPCPVLKKMPMKPASDKHLLKELEETIQEMEAGIRRIRDRLIRIQQKLDQLDKTLHSPPNAKK
jgi:uncharacterized coiled-coil protein SlyX